MVRAEFGQQVEVIIVPGLLSLVCQVLFWSRVVVTGYRGTRDE